MHLHRSQCRLLRPSAVRVITTGALLALVASAPAHAATRLEGYYEAEMAAQKDDGRWRVGPPGDNGMPGHYAELKLFSSPSDKVEIFTRLWAKSNRDDAQTANVVDYYHPHWINGEGHLKLRQAKSEAFLFYRQNRFYINDEPLLRLIEDNTLKADDWGPKARGIRYDFWEGGFVGVRNLGGTFIISENGGSRRYSNYETGDPIPPGAPDGTVVGTPLPSPYDIADGENAFISRLRHKAWNGRVESGMMYLRKDWTDRGQTNWRDLVNLMHNDVWSADLSFSPRALAHTGLRLGPLNLEQSRWTGEVAYSRRPYDERVFSTPRRRAYALGAEARDMHIGALTVHAWYRDTGENFRAYMSSREYNRVQRHVEGIWLVPRKAVTAKVALDASRNHVTDVIGGGLRPADEFYGELYMEFIKGFKARFAHKRWHGYDSSAEVSDFYTYPDWFGEVSVENFLAKIRLQGRVKNAGTFRQSTAIGFDMNVNLTERLKGYLRALNVNEATAARNTLFAQVKYDLGAGSELYFEYGDAGQSDNLAYTDWFVQEHPGETDKPEFNLRDRFKLLLKAWF